MPPTFGAVYDEHIAFVWRSVRRLGVPEGEVDDVVQEVFVVIHRKLPAFEGRSHVRTWIFAILRRVVRDVLRSRARMCTEPLDEEAVPDVAVGPHAILEQRDALRTLHTLLDALDEDKREVFVLADLEGMTVPEIVEATGDNLNTVYARLRAAREQLALAYKRQRARESVGGRSVR